MDCGRPRPLFRGQKSVVRGQSLEVSGCFVLVLVLLLVLAPDGLRNTRKTRKGGYSRPFVAIPAPIRVERHSSQEPTEETEIPRPSEGHRRAWNDAEEAEASSQDQGVESDFRPRARSPTRPRRLGNSRSIPLRLRLEVRVSGFKFQVQGSPIPTLAPPRRPARDAPGREERKPRKARLNGLHSGPQAAPPVSQRIEACPRFPSRSTTGTHLLPEMEQIRQQF